MGDVSPLEHNRLRGQSCQIWRVFWCDCIRALLVRKKDNQIRSARRGHGGVSPRQSFVATSPKAVPEYPRSILSVRLRMMIYVSHVYHREVNSLFARFGQANVHRRTAAFDAGDRDFAGVRFDDGASDGEAEAGAGAFSVGNEWFEHFG